MVRYGVEGSNIAQYMVHGYAVQPHPHPHKQTVWSQMKGMHVTLGF